MSAALAQALRDFTPDELAFVRQFKIDEMHIDAGASFLRQGTRNEHLYTVLSGWAFRYKMLDDGRRQILNFALPADMVGLQGSVDGRDGAFGRGADADVRLCVFPRGEAVRPLQPVSDAGVRHHLAGGARGATASTSIFCQLGRRTALERTAYLLLLLFVRAQELGLAPGQRRSSFRSPSSIWPTRSACRWCTPTRR